MLRRCCRGGPLTCLGYRGGPVNATATARRLGDFEILRELGRGGMGVVYEARQLSLNRRVALKVLAGSVCLSPGAVARFKREAEAAAKLHHTNIVPVYSTGEENGTHYYAMELVEGPSLDRVIANTKVATGIGPGPPRDPDSAARDSRAAPDGAPFRLDETLEYQADGPGESCPAASNVSGIPTPIGNRCDAAGVVSTASTLHSGGDYFDAV